MKEFKNIIEKHVKTPVSWTALSPEGFVELNLNDACESVKSFFLEAIPKDTYEINGEQFLNEKDIIQFSKHTLPAEVGFPFGYTCIALAPDWECWVMEKTTGRVLYLAYEFVNDDGIVDAITLNELEVNKKNFPKAVRKHEIFSNVNDFLHGPILDTDAWIDTWANKDD